MAEQTPDSGSTPPEPPEGGPPNDPPDLERALGDASEAVNELNQEAAASQTRPGPAERPTPAPAGAKPAATPGATRGAAASAVGAGSGASPVAPSLPDFDLSAVGVSKKDIDLLSDVNLNVTIELGRTRMLIEDVLKLAAGAVIELEKLAGDPVDVFVNERLVAKGEVLVLNDNFCVRINEIVDAAAADRA